MKKDYLLTRLESPTGEADFLEDHWTRHWESHNVSPDPASVRQREEYQHLSACLDTLPRGSRILDGGCGLGDWTIYLANRGFQVVGLDISNRIISRLQERYSGGRFQQGDIRTTGLPASAFDLYFSWGTFEHFEVGPGDCITEAYRLLRPGGLLLISVPYHNWRFIFKESRFGYQWRQAFRVPPGTPISVRFYQWRFTPAELTMELETRGFQVQRLVPIHHSEGVRRALDWELGLKPGTRWHYLAERLIAPFLPKTLVCHMLLAVARKPEAV